MGSGKSYWGRRLAEALNFEFIDLDDYIENKTRQTILDIFNQHGESYFRKLESDCLREISQQSNIVLALGGGTPCSDLNIEWIKKIGISFFINPGVQIIINRLMTETNHRPLLKGKSKEELATFVYQKLEDRMPYYQQADYTIEEEDVVAFAMNIWMS
jgi:shikimate kinase